MKRYLVKAIAKATDDNPNFKGETHIYFYGKDNSCEDSIDDFNHWDWIVGWSHERWAKRFIENEILSNTLSARYSKSYWTYDYEIVSYDCKF